MSESVTYNRIIFWALQVVVGILISISLWGTARVSEAISTMRDKVECLKTEIEVIKGNRFTSKDGLEVWKEIQDIRQEIAVIKANSVNTQPPKWLTDRLDKIEATMERRLDAVERKLTLLDNGR